MNAPPRHLSPALALQGSGPVALDAVALVLSTALAFYLCYDTLPQGTLRSGATLALALMVGLQLLFSGVLGVYGEAGVRATLIETLRLTFCGLGSVLIAVQVIELGSFWGVDDLLSRPFVALTIALDIVCLTLVRGVRLLLQGPEHNRLILP